MMGTYIIREAYELIQQVWKEKHMTDPAQACGNCKWWKMTEPYELGAMWPHSLGECQFPLPFFVRQSSTFDNDGEDCRAWQAK